MIGKRPGIFIYSHQGDSGILREICAGIEEEGLFYEIIDKQGSIDELAYQASAESMLGCGIGIIKNKVAMQMQPLPQGNHIFAVENPSPEQSRALGANSARGVKRMPFRAV